MANTYIKPSAIHGLGLFASVDIKEGDKIVEGPANYTFIDEWIRFNKAKQPSYNFEHKLCMVNHSDNPNTKRNMRRYRLYASKEIKKDEEITEDYNLLPDDDNPFKVNQDEDIFRNVWKVKKKIK